jgi:hypothetical protein
MTTVPTNLEDAKAHLRDARHKASPFVEKFARFGYAAKGVVYCVVGGLAAFAALGSGGETTGSRGALETLSEQPFGRILLGIVAFGLGGYALWQFIRAIEDPENEGQGGKAIAKRIGFFISGVLHFALVWYAIGIVTGAATGNSGGGGGDDGAQSWSAKAMSYPMGRWFVFLTGLGILGYGVYQLVRAFKSELGKRLHLGQLEQHTYRAVVAVSRFGLAARGVVFGIIGGFLAMAAYHHNPNEARGVAGALDTLQRQPYGPWLLGAVAIGLIGYGIHQFVTARYRRISPE